MTENWRVKIGQDLGRDLAAHLREGDLLAALPDAGDDDVLAPQRRQRDLLGVGGEHALLDEPGAVAVPSRRSWASVTSCPAEAAAAVGTLTPTPRLMSSWSSSGIDERESAASRVISFFR